jgi:hypothetical protein
VAGKPVGCRCVRGFCSAGDPGCRDRNSFSESPACDDGLENEESVLEQDDRIDFHGRGFFGFDFANDNFSFNAGFRLPDPGCRAAWSDDEAPACNDGSDNDHDIDEDNPMNSFIDFAPGEVGTVFKTCQLFAGGPPDTDLTNLHCGAPAADTQCGPMSSSGLGGCSTSESFVFPDPECLAPWQNSEGPKLQSLPCGLGAELVLVVPLLWAVRVALRRRRRASSAQPG